jgi:uncharacterized protein CbrC (UPF0167 family)
MSTEAGQKFLTVRRACADVVRKDSGRGWDMDLPVFTYHPDPLASGSVAASDTPCTCCKARRGFIYTGPAYCEAELDDAICPWCIADGAAHKAFDASFTDPAGFPDGVPPDVVDEIAYRTPGFNSWQQGK